MNNGTKKVVNLIISVISYIVLALSIVLLLTVLISKMQNKTPSVLGYSFFIVATPSMSPEIEIGDLVISKVVEKSELKIGDDVVFYTDDPKNIAIGVDIIVHRIIGISDNGEEFTTKGINNLSEDDYKAVRVIGKKVAQSRFIGNIFVFLTKGYNIFFAVILIIIIGIAVSVIRNIFRINGETKKE